MKRKKKCVEELIARRLKMGLVRPPMSLAFCHGKGRRGTPMAGIERISSLRPDYPKKWDEVKCGVRRLAKRGDEWVCSCCNEATEPRLLQIAHLGWEPGNLRAAWLLPLCPNCHRIYDKVQQDSGAALTMAGERTLTHERLWSRIEYVCQEVGRWGVIRLSPAGIDLVVAAAIQENQPLHRSDLLAAVTELAPEVAAALYSSGAELVMEAALRRLRMRQVDASGLPFVTHGLTLKLNMPKLHVDPRTSTTPVCRWTNPRYLK